MSLIRRSEPHFSQKVTLMPELTLMPTPVDVSVRTVMNEQSMLACRTCAGRGARAGVYRPVPTREAMYLAIYTREAMYLAIYTREGIASSHHTREGIASSHHTREAMVLFYTPGRLWSCSTHQGGHSLLFTSREGIASSSHPGRHMLPLPHPGRHMLPLPHPGGHSLLSS